MDGLQLHVYVVAVLSFLATQTYAQIEDGRLPGTLAPSHYNVTVTPDIYTGAPPFDFSGHVVIFFDCLEATSDLYLNQYSLNIDTESIRLSVDPSSPVQPPQPQWTNLGMIDELEMLVLELQDDLMDGASYILEIEYFGTLASPGGWPDGLFYDTYTQDGESKYMAGTNFYPRAWMPCFDEPSYKATFSLIVARKDGMVALMNTPLVDQYEGEDGWIYDVFETTPVMPPYIVCFFVGAFQYVEVVSDNGIVSRVWSRPDLVYAMEFAASTAAKMIDWFEDWTQVPYPLAKMDHIAVPSMGGAMENWGLILYGESSLLYDPELSTEATKSGAAHIIGHELAHQWFGDIVTYAWWDEAWLNEGFASFFEYMPFQDTLGWNGDELHLMDDCWGIMDTDSTNRSQPVRIEVVSPWERWDAFSSQAYTKGGCVVRTIRQILGADTFNRAITRYLNEHSYGNVVTDDLFDSLDEQAAEDGITDTDGSPLVLADKLYPLLNQMGFPAVTATRTGDQLSLAQTQYQNPRAAYDMPESPYEYQWNVPVTIATSSNPDFTTLPATWMDRENVSACCELEPSDAWYLINSNGGAYFRVQYDAENQQAVINQLLDNLEEISVESRAQFVQDTVMLAEAGYSGELRILDASAYLDQESSLLPWISASRGLDYPALMLTRFPDTDILMESYTEKQSRPLYDSLGWDMEVGDDAHMTKLLRALILELACSSGQEDCVSEAQALYAQWMDDPTTNTPVPDLKHVVACSAISAGGQDQFNFALAQYRQIVDSTPTYLYRPVRDVFLRGMACATEERILEGYIVLAFDSTTIPTRDASAAMTAIASSPTGRDVMWRHLQTTWESNPVPGGVTRGNVLQTVVNGFSSQQDLDEFEAFVSLYPPQNDVDRNVYDRARATLTENVSWTDTNQQNFHQWLESNKRRTSKK